MTEAIAFPDAETLLVNYLEPLLGVPVSTKIRGTYPFVRVNRVGGPRSNLVTDRPMVTFEAWAASTVDASDLARRARAYVGALAQSDVGGEWVRRVNEVVGLQDNPDPETETPRYTFTVQLDVRGTPL